MYVLLWWLVRCFFPLPWVVRYTVWSSKRSMFQKCQHCLTGHRVIYVFLCSVTTVYGISVRLVLVDRHSLSWYWFSATTCSPWSLVATSRTELYVLLLAHFCCPVLFFFHCSFWFRHTIDDLWYVTHCKTINSLDNSLLRNRGTSERIVDNRQLGGGCSLCFYGALTTDFL